MEEREKHEFQTGPLSVLTQSVKNNTQVLINSRNNRKLMGRVKVIRFFNFWPKFPFLPKISIFHQNFGFWSTFRFLTKISSFDQNFGFWATFRYLTKILVFERNFDFLPKFRFFTKISIFYQNFDFSPKFRFLINMLIFEQNFGFWDRKFRLFTVVQFFRFFSEILTNILIFYCNLVFWFTIQFLIKIAVFYHFDLGIWSALQHGVGKCERNVGRTAQKCERKRRTTGKPRPVHFENVPTRRFSRYRPQKSSRSRQIKKWLWKIIARIIVKYRILIFSKILKKNCLNKLWLLENFWQKYFLYFTNSGNSSGAKRNYCQ